MDTRKTFAMIDAFCFLKTHMFLEGESFARSIQYIGIHVNIKYYILEYRLFLKMLLIKINDPTTQNAIFALRAVENFPLERCKILDFLDTRLRKLVWK